VTPFIGRAESLSGSQKMQRAGQAAGVVTLMIAATALAGWWGRMPRLSSWGLNFIAVEPPVAIGLAALGLALVHPGKDWLFAWAVDLAVCVLAALGLGMAVFPAISGWPAGPETALFQVPNASLLALVLAGGAMVLSRFERQRIAATVLAGLAGVISVFALLGYLAGIGTLYGSTSVSLPPLPVATALLLIVCGIILRAGRMPALRTARPLRHLLIALGCAIVAPLLLFGVYAGVRMAEAQIEQVRKDLMSETRTVSAEIDRQIVEEIEKLWALAASPSLRQGDFAAFQYQAEAAQAEHHGGTIVLIDRDMTQIVNTVVSFGTPMPKAVVQESVERALATGKPQFTGLFMAPVAGKLLFAIVVPVEIDGANRYALVSSPDRQAFVGLVSARELPPGWQAAVTDASHRILARSGQENGAIGTTLPKVQWHPEGPAGILSFTDPDGRTALQAYVSSDLTGWETAVWEPEALLEAPVRALWRTLGGLALLASALVVTLALWLGRLIASSVGHAANVATALGECSPLPPGGTPVTEVNVLVDLLHESAARREAVEHLLRESEKTFRVMFDMSSVPKIEVVPWDGRFLRANAAMCTFVGYSEAELLDMTVWDITHPDERESQREPARSLLNGELPAFDVEKRYVRKDGTPVWAHTTSNVICDEHGTPMRDIAVIQDIDARKRAEEDLRASKDRLELALDAARLGSWQFDAAHRVFTGDARAKEIFGVDIAQEEAPLDDILKRLHSDDVERVLKAIAEALDPADPKRAVTQFRLQGPRGEIRWVETLGRAYFEGAGPERRGVTIVGTCQDVTERKEREEKEYLLMREVNHRAKNMLSVVHAIAHQTATRNPEDFIARFTERIQALSANQDLLVRNEWNGVEIADLVHAQLAPFVGFIGSRIAVHGPRLRLTASSAQAIGLALHELATNAGKYGALSNDRGRVDVGWGLSAGNFTMSWTESDGPPVTPPKRRGFGNTVLGIMAERSVSGKVDLDYAPTGVTWRLTCPAATALEPTEPPARTAGGPGQGSQNEENRAGGGPQDGAAGTVVFFPRQQHPGEEMERDATGGRGPYSPQFNTEFRGR
jgi:PAS domain S-box-containing protein